MIGLAFFVYRRPEHTRKVIDSIKRNHFEKIYIFQDGLKYEKDREAWEEVFDLIQGIDFTETEIHRSNQNRGLAASILAGMDYVMERHDEAIALEDDIVLADGYKSLVEAMFSKYKNNKKVMGICGGGCGAIIPSSYPYDVYFSYRMSSMAFGTWRDRWEGFQCDAGMLQEIHRDKEKSKMLEYAGNDLEVMLVDSLKGKNDTWATYWSLYQINQLGYHIIPVKGYAQDIGRTGDGTNTTGRTERYDIELDGEQKEAYNLPDEEFIDWEIAEDTKNLFHFAENKMQQYFDILCMWMRIYQKDLDVTVYFQERGIDKVYLYGTGKLTEFLHHDLEENIDIVGYLVENRSDDVCYKGRKIYDMRNWKNIENLPIVVIPSYDIKLLKHLFAKTQVKNEIILIEDILKYTLDRENDSDDQ